MIYQGGYATHIHNIVIYNKRRAFGLRFITHPDLSKSAITPKQLIQVVASDLVVQVFDKENAIGPRRELCL